MRKTSFLPLLLLLCAPAFAQGTDDLIVIYESGPGEGLGVLLDSATVSIGRRADLNLDGVPDLTMLSLDEQDNPVEFITLNVASLDTLWRYSYQDVADALGTQHFRFIGFASFRDGGPRSALFKAPDGGALMIIAILVGLKRANDPVVLPAERFAVLDLIGDDGFPEIVIRNSETNTVQVYGSMTSTATEEEIEASLARLFQNYPNPFRDHTTIAYEVDRPGPVTVTVYDLLGRRVRTLVDERQPVGVYQLAWDGRDTGGQPVASGTYFYRLRVGESVSSKQAIRIK